MTTRRTTVPAALLGLTALTLTAVGGCVDEPDSAPIETPAEAAGQLFDPAIRGARTAALELRRDELRLLVDGQLVQRAPRGDFVASPGGRTTWGDEGLRAMVGDWLVDETGRHLAPLPRGALSVAVGPGTTYVLADTTAYRLDGDALVPLSTIGPLSRSCPASADASWLYYTDTRAWEVRRIPVAGGPSEVYAGMQRDACGVVVGDVWVSWIADSPTLATYVVSYTKTDLPPADYVMGSGFIGRYTPGAFGWQLAGAGPRAFAVNLHEARVYEIDKATGDVEVLAHDWTGLGGVAAHAGRIVVARGSELLEVSPTAP